MAWTDDRGARMSSSEYRDAVRAAGRYPGAEAVSLSDIDEDDDTHDDEKMSEVEAYSSAEPARKSSRPTSQGLAQQQPFSNGRVFSGDRAYPINTSRETSDDVANWTQPQEANTAAYGLQTAAFAAPFQPSFGSTGRRHANGLPARQPSGLLPGMPILSELLSRYPVRQVRGSGPQISLVSGQLYVSNRLREAASAQKVPLPAPAVAQYPLHNVLGFPAPEMLVPTYAHECTIPPSSYMEQRRTEREQRAIYTGQQQQQQFQQQQSGRNSWASPHQDLSTGTAGRAGSAPAATDGRNGDGAGCGGADSRATFGGSVRQREVREGVERWLETNGDDSGGGQEHNTAASRPLNDPSLMYRQYGIFRAYGKASLGLWPSTSMPAQLRNGHRVAFERKRTSSGAGGAGVGVGVSPMRVSSQPALAWAAQPARQGAW